MVHTLAPRPFEDEVRRIARARWPAAALSGAAILEGRERDGVFETDECVHFLECTTSRTADKAREDTKKLFKAIAQQHKKTPFKAARGWLVTQHEPTADQRTEVDAFGKGQVSICSFSQFQQSIVDAPAYLSARKNHFFGSVMDPATQKPIPSVAYVPLDIAALGSGELFTVRQLSERLIAGDCFVLVGDYGAGKSMTLREIFFHLLERYLRGLIQQFPVYINLREHSGQDDPSELLERHARRIGFASPAALVRAWKAGFIVAIVDGFDEITTLGVSGLRLRLREIRRNSLQAVRRLFEQSPAGAGWIVAGREHFFDSDGERNSALGLPESVKVLTLNEFTEEQVREYLERAAGLKGAMLPAWLPTRPLLVGNFVARGLIEELPVVASQPDSVDGWNFLIGQICEREAKIAATLDGPTLRRIMERLASVARSSSDGLGPLSQDEIRRAFIAISGYEPDEQANLILQRMPGLGVYRAEDNSRTFVDAELAEVCRARDVVDFVGNPYLCLSDSGWVNLFTSIGTSFGKTAAVQAARESGRRGIANGQLRGAREALSAHPQLKALRGDYFLVCCEMNQPIVDTFAINGVFFEQSPVEFSGESPDLHGVHFETCFFDEIELTTDCGLVRLPRFSGCAVARIAGRTSVADLPPGKFDASCEIESFTSSAETVSAILVTPLSRGEKIVLSLLRKLYIQSLGGRSGSALERGLELNDRAYVRDALKLLQQNHFVSASGRGDYDVWLPNRKMLGRVRRMLAAPSTCEEKLLVDARVLTPN